MIVSVHGCHDCPFINEGELDRNCNVYHEKPYNPLEVDHDDYEMLYELPYDRGAFPKLCPLKSGEIIVSLCPHSTD
jgi:hypothetical protein